MRLNLKVGIFLGHTERLSQRERQPKPVPQSPLPSKAGSLAMLLAMCLASSSVSTFAIWASLAFSREDISERLAVSVNHLEPAWNSSQRSMEAENGGRAHVLNSQASRLFSISDGGMEFDMPNCPTNRETSRKDTGDAVTIGLVLAAVVATFVLFGPVLVKSDQKSMDVVATQPTDSPIKTP